MRLLKDYAQQVWMLTDLADKKLVALEMINEFEYKGKQAVFKVQLERMRTTTKVDEFAANLALIGSDMKVIR